MLTSQVIFMKHLYGQPEAISGNHLHGFFFKKILGTQDPRLAEIMHDPKISKPLAISYMFPWKHMYWFRISSWDERIPEAVFSYFNKHKEIELNRCGFQLIKTTTHPDESLWANRQSVQAFIDSYSNEIDRFRLVHKGATSFKTGNAHIPLPVPDLVISSIYRKLPPPLMESIQHIKKEELIEALQLKGYQIDSIYNKKTYGSITAFKGVTRWQLDKKSSLAVRKAINLMFHFSFYSGIGVKTSQGMGMCRIV